MKLPEHLRQDRIPSIDCRGLPFPEAVHAAVVAVLEQGVVRLRGAYEPARLEVWREQFIAHTLGAVERNAYRYRHWSLGDRRHHYILEIHRAFNDPAFYANPFLYAVATALLEGDFMMATAAVAYAEAGAAAQPVHRDQPLMFAGSRQRRPRKSEQPDKWIPCSVGA
ncbi:MAG: hypothetical protein ACOY33_04840 [Pseudomonadota bacterium]